MPEPTDLNPPRIWLKFEKKSPTAEWELIVPLHDRRYPVTPEVGVELDLMFLILEFEVPVMYEVTIDER